MFDSTILLRPPKCNPFMLSIFFDNLKSSETEVQNGYSLVRSGLTQRVVPIKEILTDIRINVT